MTVNIKSPEEIEKMRRVGQLAADVLNMIGPHVQPGILPKPFYGGSSVRIPA